MGARDIVESVVGHSISILWEKESNCAHLVGFGVSGAAFVAKIPAFAFLSKLDPKERAEEAKFINRATNHFIRLLAFYRIPLPSKYYCVLSRDGYAVHVMSDEGVDCAKLAQRDPGQLPAMLREILTAICGGLSQKSPEIGIDARLSNFALNGHGVVYFDVFPPLLGRGERIFAHGDYDLVHYPNPKDPEVIQREVERKFQPFGILRRLRFDLLAVDPDWEASFFEALPVLGEPLMSEIIEKFKVLPDSSIATLSREERTRLVEGIPATEVDTLREIAVKLVTLRGEERQRFMHEIFFCTSLAITKDPAEHEARLARYRQLIQPYL